jgi:hypothetical protein
MRIEKLIVLNGSTGDYEFAVGCTSRLGKVEKIKKHATKEDVYIVFLEGYKEVEVATDRILVLTQY